MATVEPSVMLNSVMGKLYDVLTNGDDTVPTSEDNFFSWATPGIPIEEEDFEFLSQGLTGVVKKAKLNEITGQPVDGAPQVEITPQLLDQLRAQDTARLYMQAENFARLVDFVPDVASTTNGQLAQLSVMNNEGTLSDRYEYILRMSQVMEAQLPEDTKAKIEKFRELLSVTKIKKNIIDDSETEVTEPGPITVAYNEKMAEYEAAALEYISRKIDALTADDPRAVHLWAQSATILRNRVRAAMNTWVSSGFKNEYEQIAAFIDQVTQRDMALLKQQYRDDLDKARLTGLASGSDFYYTSLVPGNFLEAAGWTEFGFSSSDFNSVTSSGYDFKSSRSKGGGGFFGVFGAGGSSSHAQGETRYSAKFDSSTFGLSFKIAQIPIVRPWFRTSFMMSKLWRFDQNNPEAKSQMVSDGGEPPKGLIPAYPTMLICIKDLWLRFGERSGAKDMVAKWESDSASGGAYLAWGPWHLGGSHARHSSSGERSSRVHFDHQTQTLRVPGAQVVGFKCHLFPTCPDPDSSITSWV